MGIIVYNISPVTQTTPYAELLLPNSVDHFKIIVNKPTLITIKEAAHERHFHRNDFSYDDGNREK